MESKIMPKVFGWMFIGLMVTFVTGFFVQSNPKMIASIFGSAWFIGVIIAEFVLVILLSAKIRKMKATTARICFLLYSFVSGLTFSTIFITYEMTNIIWIFLVSATIFGVFAVLGSVTKKDLTKIGSFLLMALVGILICVLLNLFFHSETLELLLSIVIVLVFIGFTAYDVQRIKWLSESNAIPEENLAIYGALQLYLDFINIFLELLRLFGNSDN